MFLKTDISMETKRLQEKPIFDFAFFVWDKGKIPKTITVKGKRLPFSFPFTGILILENGKPKRFSVIRFLFFIFRLHFVSCSRKNGNKKNGKNVFSFRFLYPFPQEGRHFLYFV